jgi:hypothetical protein
MMSFPLVSSRDVAFTPVVVRTELQGSKASPRARSLPRPWRYGRGYAVITLLAPVVLSSLLLVYLHNVAKIRLSLWRL